MVKGINQIIPLAQGTMTGLAIKYVMNAAFTAEEGDRPKVQQHTLHVSQSLEKNSCLEQIMSFESVFSVCFDKVSCFWCVVSTFL